MTRARLNEALTLRLITSIRAGDPVPVVHVATGVPASTVRWVAAKYGLTEQLRINSRYELRPRGPGFWAKYAKPRSALQRALNAQTPMSLIAQHGNEAPCTAEETQ